MTKISLREYLGGVEELIEAGQTDEAITHCRHILETFPKNVDTYRLMGKTYLESQRYAEAADIFQRVLSSCPDDFVAHIGMSIVRENETNQDAAVWHMERAFEAQPSNRAIQDELRRLYGLREGSSPAKVRLTRGALARMYAHGNLYNQAITELQNALSEDPQRPDLQVLLAEMYARSDQQPEAIEVCHELIGKLPYCLYANQLMATILQETRRDAEAAPYLSVVEELDPYAALAKSAELVSEVPAETVQLEHLVVESAAPEALAMPRSWTGTLEPIVEEEPNFEKEDLPAWLDGNHQDMVSEETEAAPAESADQLEEADSGFQPEPSADQEAGPVPNEEDIPEWLRELRPSAAQAAAPAAQAFAEEANEGEDLDWMKEFDQSGFGDSQSTETSHAFEDGAPEPDEVAPASALENNATLSGQEDDSEDLGWLESLAAREGVSGGDSSAAVVESSEQAPTRLDPAEEAKETGNLAWLDEMAGDTDQHEQDQPSLDFAAQMESLGKEDEALPADQGAEEGAGDAPDWLKDLAEEVESAPGQEPQGGADFLKPAPDWLDDLRPDIGPGEQYGSEIEEEQQAEGFQFGDEAEELSKHEDFSLAADDADDLDWLDELSTAPATRGKEIPLVTEEDEVVGAGLSKEILDKDILEELGQAGSVEGAWIPEAELAAVEVDERPAPEQTPAPAAARQPASPAPSPRSRLEQARQTLGHGKVEDAALEYGKLVGKRQLLEDVVADLQAALSRYPQSVSLLQTLGDAYMRTDHLREALDCYTRAEDLL